MSYIAEHYFGKVVPYIGTWIETLNRSDMHIDVLSYLI